MQPSFLRGMRQDIHKKEYKKRKRKNFEDIKLCLYHQTEHILITHKII